MKLCLVILAISLFDFSKGQTFQCGPNEIAKIDGCVPARPADFDNPQCMDKCVEKGSSCTVQDVPIFLWDQTSIYTCQDPGTYTTRVECKARIIRTCDEETVTVEDQNIKLKCQEETINYCLNATRPVQRLVFETVKSTTFTTECYKQWQTFPCIHDPTQPCKGFLCNPSIPAISRPVTTSKIIQHVVDDIEEYVRCEERAVQTCHEDITSPSETSETMKEYTRLSNCHREPLEDCYTYIIPDECEEVQHIVQTLKRITRKVAVCDVGSSFDSVPHIYDDCESSQCAEITEAAFDSITNNPNYNETTGQIIPKNLLSLI